MRTSLFGYFFGMITVLTAAVMLLTSLPTISTLGNGRHNSRPAIARTVTVELQRRSLVTKQASLAKDVSPVVATAKADTKKASITSPKHLPVTPKTTAMGTHWVMLNLGTARAVSFSADLARARLDSLDRRFLLSGHVVV